MCSLEKSSQVNFIYEAQYNKSQICFMGFSMCTMPCIDWTLINKRKNPKNGKSWKTHRHKNWGGIPLSEQSKIDQHNKITLWTISMTKLLIEQMDLGESPNRPEPYYLLSTKETRSRQGSRPPFTQIQTGQHAHNGERKGDWISWRTKVQVQTCGKRQRQPGGEREVPGWQKGS